jgi:putative peptidoglycan lipid II flippase
MGSFRDELALLLLMVTGLFVYGVCILVLFGRGWIFRLIRG